MQRRVSMWFCCFVTLGSLLYFHTSASILMSRLWRVSSVKLHHRPILWFSRATLTNHGRSLIRLNIRSQTYQFNDSELVGQVITSYDYLQACLWNNWRHASFRPIYKSLCVTFCTYILLLLYWCALFVHCFAQIWALENRVLNQKRWWFLKFVYCQTDDIHAELKSDNSYRN